MPALLLILALAALAAGLFIAGVFVIGGLGPALISGAACSLGAAILLRRGLILG